MLPVNSYQEQHHDLHPCDVDDTQWDGEAPASPAAAIGPDTAIASPRDLLSELALQMNRLVKIVLYLGILLLLVAGAILGTVIGNALVGGMTPVQVARFLGIVAGVQVIVIGWLLNIVLDCKSRERKRSLGLGRLL